MEPVRDPGGRVPLRHDELRLGSVRGRLLREGGAEVRADEFGDDADPQEAGVVVGHPRDPAADQWPEERGGEHQRDEDCHARHHEASHQEAEAAGGAAALRALAHLPSGPGAGERIAQVRL